MSTKQLISPEKLWQIYPLSDKSRAFIQQSRREVASILKKKSSKKLLIFGPCSVHHVEEMLEYAKLFKGIAKEVDSRFFCVLRVYIEKPRSCLGWKGLLYDPKLDESANLLEGLKLSRQLLLQLTQENIPVAIEFLEPLVSQYFQDLITWGSIGARTASSQIHRQLAATLPFPVGFKNPIDGNLKVACESILASQHPHTYFGVDTTGHIAQINARGNPHTHLVLRGSFKGGNHDSSSLRIASEILKKMGLNASLIVDCAHGNSNKTLEGQVKCFEELVQKWQQKEGSCEVVGGMLESYLQDGKQLIMHPENWKKGVSITDPCLGYQTTYSLIKEAYKLLSNAYSSSGK